MEGAYKLAHMEPCTLPQKVAPGFTEVTMGLTGASYVPVLYVGEQVVHGLNHMVICLEKQVDAELSEHLVKMVLNQNLDDGSPVGKWTLVNIERIV